MDAPRLFRLLHKPTGLCFRPSSFRTVKARLVSGETRSFPVKTNLSKTGKIYVGRKPPIPSAIFSHLGAHEPYERQPVEITEAASWEIQEFVNDSWEKVSEN